MAEVAEAVDDGNIGPGGQFLECAVLVYACHERIDPAFKVARDVRDRLAHADLGVFIHQVDCEAAELGHANHEGGAGAQGRLLEKHGEAAAGQQVMRLAGGLHSL